MCGRAYETFTEDELEMRYQWARTKRNPLGLQPNYNLCPTQNAPVVVRSADENTVKLMRWGLVPNWAKTIKDASKYSLINARGEEITEKRSYKNAFANQRCIVPLSGFFEWRRETEKGPKVPFAIYLKDEPIMSIAGIWERWHSEDSKEEVYSFSIVTTEANSFMKKIHDRMPVILDREMEKVWLDPTNHDTLHLKTFLKPCPSNWLSAHEVSSLVIHQRTTEKRF